MKAMRTALIGMAIIGVSSQITLAQPTSESAAGAQSAPASAMQGPMTGKGMMNGGMMRGQGMGPGCMCALHGPGEMGMSPMAMQEIRRDPKLMGRLMELRGEMLRTVGEALIERGKRMQQDAGKPAAPGQ